MEENEILQRTIFYVQQTLKDSERGHDWFHILRVYRQADLISLSEPGDKQVIRLAALLHDIADSKFHMGDENLGSEKARAFLFSLELPLILIEKVSAIVKDISYSSNLEKENPKTEELKIVQDADRLDAIGAIGIARAFHYGGYKNREIYNPDLPPQTSMNKALYKTSNSPTLNHFYEKLLLLKDKMNTTTGKKMAQSRHEFLEIYLNQFYKEWNEFL
ncbi:MAG: HD domain-containing protein [Saprospiraceae bacterium]|nr:HD domain-containing protein [Saprospiraceae bacterium]